MLKLSNKIFSVVSYNWNTKLGMLVLNKMWLVVNITFYIMLDQGFFLFSVGQAYEVKLTVDDIHKLYASGQLKSSGSDHSKEYTVNIGWAPVLALYAEDLVSI